MRPKHFLTRREALASSARAVTLACLGSCGFPRGASFARANEIPPALPATLFVSHPCGLAHDPGPGQPDRPERLGVILRALARDEFQNLARAQAPEASREAILSAHSQAHLALLEKASPREGRAGHAPDVIMSEASLTAALHAAGGAVFAVDEVMSGRVKNAFVAMRPPGHHATRNAPMGFCFFNNAAVAARHALAAHGLERVAIVDFDVHHGNGVQEIFWAERNVLYCSTHQMPLYPGTGAESETGEYGNIVNAPLRKGDGGEEFRAACVSRILPRLDAFRPDIVILCAGFDAHIHDPLGGLRLVDHDFREATLRIMEIAATRCGGRIVSLLEGGYRPEDLAASVAAHVGALMEA